MMHNEVRLYDVDHLYHVCSENIISELSDLSINDDGDEIEFERW